MRLAKTVGLGLAASLLFSVAACGTAAPDSGFGDPSGAGGAGGFGAGDPAGGDNGLGGNGGGTSKPADDLAACATSTAAAEAKPVYLVFAYDKSGSMGQSGKWTAAKAAMKGFFGSPDGAGVNASLTFFPQGGNICKSSNYASPQASMTALPSSTLGAALDDADPNGGTPTADALAGAISYAESVASGQGKDGTVAIVMVTDGIPDGCDDTGDVSYAASEAAAVQAQIKTYVVGVGNELSNLNDIAAAGGTGTAFVVSVGDPAKTQTDLTKAISAIKTSALSCDYEIPAPPDGQTFDRSKVNVQFTPDGAAASALDYNPTCSGGEGWRYDDATAPTRVIACDGTCDAIKGKSGKVDIVFGCETKTGPVK
jgi:hypothetical protein